MQRIRYSRNIQETVFRPQQSFPHAPNHLQLYIHHAISADDDCGIFPSSTIYCILLQRALKLQVVHPGQGASECSTASQLSASDNPSLPPHSENATLELCLVPRRFCDSENRENECSRNKPYGTQWDDHIFRMPKVAHMKSVPFHTQRFAIPSAAQTEGRHPCVDKRQHEDACVCQPPGTDA